MGSDAPLYFIRDFFLGGGGGAWGWGGSKVLAFEAAECEVIIHFLFLMIQNDPQSPHYASSPHPTEHTVVADMSVVKVQILKGSLVKLMSMGLSVMDEIM